MPPYKHLGHLGATPLQKKKKSSSAPGVVTGCDGMGVGSHGSKVLSGSTSATLPRLCRLLSKRAASHTLMWISKTKGEGRGGEKKGFDFSEIYGRDEINFE